MGPARFPLAIVDAMSPMNVPSGLMLDAAPSVLRTASGASLPTLEIAWPVSGNAAEAPAPNSADMPPDANTRSAAISRSPNTDS